MCGRGPVENVTREVEVETTRTVSELVPVTKTVTTTVTKLVPVVQNKTVVVPRTTYTNETTVSVSPAARRADSAAGVARLNAFHSYGLFSHSCDAYCSLHIRDEWHRTWSCCWTALAPCA